MGMKISEILKLPTNELSLVLEGLVYEYEKLKKGIESAVDPDRKKMTTINRKIIKVTIELRHRGWEAIECEGKVEYKPLYNGMKQENLI